MRESATGMWSGAVLLTLLLISCQNQNHTERLYGDEAHLEKGSDTALNFLSIRKTEIDELLKNNPTWRLAKKEDNTNSSLQDLLKAKSDYQPYFIEHDFNKDGLTDFAVMIRRDSVRADSMFAAYWFPAKDGGYGSAQFLASSKYLNQAGFFWFRERLQIGEPESDVIYAEFEWDEESQMLKAVPYDPSEWE